MSECFEVQHKEDIIKQQNKNNINSVCDILKYHTVLKKITGEFSPLCFFGALKKAHDLLCLFPP
jgi:hypothetical protein